MPFTFFFSSRRRHTRWPRDWSSDVCSSDLIWRMSRSSLAQSHAGSPTDLVAANTLATTASVSSPRSSKAAVRSEERRVGKECRAGRAEVVVEKLHEVADGVQDVMDGLLIDR